MQIPLLFAFEVAVLRKEVPFPGPALFCLKGQFSDVGGKAMVQIPVGIPAPFFKKTTQKGPSATGGRVGL
jgi:hypothetical protein